MRSLQLFAAPAVVTMMFLGTAVLAQNTPVRMAPVRNNQPNPGQQQPPPQQAGQGQQGQQPAAGGQPAQAAGQGAGPAQQAGGQVPANEHLDPTTDPPQNEIIPIEREYDRFQDKISIKAEGIRPQIAKGESRIFVNFTSVTDGKEVTVKPEKVQLNLLSVADDFQYGELREGLELILLINDRRVRIPAKFLKAGMTRDRSPKALESFVCIIDAPLVVELATANSVEAQLGNTEMKLGVAEKLSVRRFAEEVKLMDPMPKQAGAAIGALNTNGAKPDLVAQHIAEIQEKMTQEKVDKLTGAAIARLEQKPEYLSAFKKAQEMELKKDQMAPGPDRSEVSQQLLEAKSKLSLIKSQALLEDAELSAARKELSDIQSKVKASKTK